MSAKERRARHGLGNRVFRAPVSLNFDENCNDIGFSGATTLQLELVIDFRAFSSLDSHPELRRLVYTIPGKRGRNRPVPLPGTNMLMKNTLQAGWGTRYEAQPRAVKLSAHPRLRRSCVMVSSIQISQRCATSCSTSFSDMRRFDRLWARASAGLMAGSFRAAQRREEPTISRRSSFHTSTHRDTTPSCPAYKHTQPQPWKGVSSRTEQ